MFYRDSRLGVLQVCDRENLDETYGCKKSIKLESIEPVNFPQYGQLRFAEFKVPLFKKKDMKISLNESGEMTYFHMKSQKAAAAAALGAAADATKTIADALEARETERRNDLEYQLGAQLKETSTQIDTLKKQKELEELLKKPGDPDPEAEQAAAAAAALELDIQQRKAQLTQQLLIAAQSEDPAVALQILAAINAE